MDDELKLHIEGAVNRAMKYTQPSKRMAQFLKTKPFRGYTPLRVNTLSAVFLNEEYEKKFILKRTILRGPSQESDIAMRIKHENIMETYDYCLTEAIDSSDDGDYLYLFSEYMDVKISQAYIEKKEINIRNIMTDILKGLKYLHDLNIAHLDLKIANIMGQTQEDKSVVYKIIDFGFSRNLNLYAGRPDRIELKGKSYGTFPYKPPEVIYYNIHGFKSDIWCLGAICYYLSLGRTPFFKKGGERINKDYRNFAKKPVLYIPDGFSNNFTSFVESCLKTDYDERPSVDELLEHPFIKNN
ncbi:serine/threonine-protein kinase PLK4-like [Lepeophtheirus salmonis]|uniref:serine/threonine-protein kinase PLK4-like n=1 Tax=Lepeophtheirus salmonis TaxID=72036 RepID=UPI001AE40119|nr:serine/threonine-protein kinase PLK4-like [Lepeophtheirus salmonis]